MRVFLLDMGDEKYGDCVLVESSGRTVLVDGGHIRDDRDRGGTLSIPNQLAAILGHGAPFEIDLLVVTHCHGDHIGCLPALIADRIVVPARALVAHPDLGYPPIDDDGRDASDTAVEKVVAALREEPRSDFASDAELDQFLTDALNLEQRYRQMVETLEESGIPVIRFAGSDDPGTQEDLADLAEQFRELGLAVLGPTQSHVLRCTEVIEQSTRQARRAAESARRRDDVSDAAGLYRLLSGMRTPIEVTDAARFWDTYRMLEPNLRVLSDDITTFLDRPGKGAALNNQSIVLKLGTGADAALLTGDMQFAEAEVGDLDAAMSELLASVAEAKPYGFVKIAHHASYNGFDRHVAEALAGTKVYGVSTGRGDPGHPHEGVLSLFQDLPQGVRWVRTDKNGGVEITLADGSVDLKVARGRLNDGSVNHQDAVAPVIEPSPGGSRPAPSLVEIKTGLAGDQVEVMARIPHTSTRVTITVDIQPGVRATLHEERRPEPVSTDPEPATPAITDPGPESGLRLAGGRPLPPLLFVTHVPRLVKNIGRSEALAATKMIEAAGQSLLDVADPDQPLDSVSQAIKRQRIAGVVIVGGYDVLRPLRYDTLPPQLRTRLGANDDPDDFIVWSDQAYGDNDGDMLGELPVSRIPDGRSSSLVKKALSAVRASPHAERFALRNVARPFAETIFDAIPGREGMLSSEPTRTRAYAGQALDAKAVYVMLHGSQADTTTFWGESARGSSLEAMSVSDIPDRFAGTVFAGCCWGALAARTTAARHRDGDPIQSLVPEQSIALSFLLRGASAFVGCTGAHYSPVESEPEAGLNFFGAPMHSAFWARIASGEPPAKALFGAKMDYIAGMPHGRRSVEEQAIEYKTLRQFTCLGFGW